MTRSFVLSLTALLLTATAFGQTDKQVITDAGLKQTIRAFTSIRGIKPIEKLYIQTDKPYYTTGDTLRFKGYLLNADYLTPSNRSGLLYVELNDTEAKNVKRIMVPVTDGLAWGQIELNAKNIPEGTYTFTAYTNWMRNFGEDYVYKQNITVSKITADAVTVKSNFNQQGNKVEAAIQLASLDGKLQVLRDMELKVMAGKKNLLRDKFITGIDGSLQFNFDVPENTGLKDLAIKAQDISKTNREPGPILTIPVTLNRAENTDIQFMPEGGNLVAGIKLKVGFKAIGEDGKGVNLSGKIIDSKGNAIADITTAYSGMGTFAFTPQANETYSAKFNGIKKTYALPVISPIGTTLSISNKNADSLQIAVTNATATNGTWYLIGQSRGVICFAETINLNGNQQSEKTIAKTLFATGITRFTLLNSTNQPVNERQVFINHHDGLKVKVTPDKANHGIRDSIALVITVTDKVGKPVQGNFSLAVTDDTQVKTDSLSKNILTNLLLTSSLRGTIENPNYYFSQNKNASADLDNLMLTQGWVGYDWKDIFNPTPSVFDGEKEFLVKGKVTNVFGKGIGKSKVVMLLNKPFAALDTLTNSAGEFIFKDMFPLDSAVINIQARNKRGREFNVGVDVEEFKAPEFKPTPLQVPWYINSDTLLLKNTQTKAAQLKAEANYRGEGTVLKEVNIVDKRTIKGSKNLNGPGGADEIIEGEYFHKANHKTLEQLLGDKYGKQFNIEPVIGGRIYRIKNHIVNFFIDGVKSNVADNMTYLSAEDIKGIEIMNSTKYAMAYDPDYTRKLFGRDSNIPIYLEVTTYSGNGAYMKKIPGTYLYRPIPFTLPKQFYRPRYTIQNSTLAMGTDMRSTLHWEPNFTTNANGKATISFYAADKPADYSVIIEGTDMEGQIGYGKQVLKSIAAK